MKLDQRSKELRKIIFNALAHGGRGHVGAALSIVEVMRVLYDDILRFDPKNPKWIGRDRNILSKGHGCLALYALLYDKGFFSEEELKRFCKTGGVLGGHPEIKVPGVEASTGSLGHGLSIGVGMAINGKYDHADYRVFVTVGDGECNEGSIWEAALCASKHKLDNLTVLIDYNQKQSYGSTHDVCELEPFAEKWKAFGFGVRECDGHNVGALKKALSNLPEKKSQPTAVICHTVKGKGISFIENNLQWHHMNKFAEDDLGSIMKELENVDA